MNLVALSRSNIEGNLAFMTQPPSVAICIAYPKGRLHAVAAMGNLLAVLHLRFSDCDGEGRWCFPEHKEGNTALPMSRDQAIEVLDFAAKWRGRVETIYSACYGGVSRSRGVLAGLAAIYEWDDKELYAHGQPNAWVKTLLLREFNARGRAG